ncbi:transcription initiation factor TFIID subunit 4-like [Pan paniscus]|uniref:transcription initiation factor TFIID subunit 4-like n=1 Tax=Pan paniscus TaxID=9597 RepID=UPI0025463EF8|nr:transcription initiation factor TFIID subunit 4-like [Pan paniscus]
MGLSRAPRLVGLQRAGLPSILGAGPLPARSQLREDELRLPCLAGLPGGAADLLIGWLFSSSCSQDSELGSQGPRGPGAGNHICPQPQSPAPVILAAPWRRRSSRRGAPAAGTAAATGPGAGVSGRRPPRAAPAAPGPGVRPAPPSRPAPRLHCPPWRRLDLSEARSDRPPQGLACRAQGPALWPCGTAPFSSSWNSCSSALGGMLGPGGPGRPNFSFLSWPLILFLLLNLCHSATKSIQASLISALRARSAELIGRAVLPRPAGSLFPGGGSWTQPFAGPPGSGEPRPAAANRPVESKSKVGSAGQRPGTMREARQSGLQAQPLGILRDPRLIMRLNPTPRTRDSKSPSPPTAPDPLPLSLQRRVCGRERDAGREKRREGEHLFISFPPSICHL